MKKIILFSGLLGLSFFFTSCKNDDDNTKTNLYNGKLLGKWHLVEKKIINTSNNKANTFDFREENECAKKDYIAFNQKNQYFHESFTEGENDTCIPLNNEIEYYNFTENGEHLTINGLQFPDYLMSFPDSKTLVLKGKTQDRDQDGKEETLINTYIKIE
ncbi:lipocalin family protein [Ornithobacterium rhinotracheale]